MKTFSLLTIFPLVLLMVLRPWDFTTIGFYAEGGLTGRLVYPFFHVGFLHLFFNWYTLLAIAFSFPIRISRFVVAYVVAISFPIATAVKLFPQLHTPTVGLSGMIYFLYGSLLFMVANKKTFLSYAGIYIAFGFWLVGGNAPLHLYTFIMGIVYAGVMRLLPNKYHYL